MRILFLTSTFHPMIGGAESYALVLARGLGALGNEIVVVTDTVAGHPEIEDIATNVKVCRLHAYRARLGAVDTIFWEEMQFGLRPELLRIATEFPPDIVLSNSLNLCVLAKLISIETGAPWVATFHEQSPEREAMGCATLKLSYGLLEPDAIIAGSRFYLERAHRFGREDRCHLIYHGIDSDQFRHVESAPDVRRHYGIPASHALLVSVGRLKARKGFLDLVRAVGVLVRAKRQVSLVIAGTLNSASAAYLDELNREVNALELKHVVHFDSSVSHDRIPWLLGGGDVVIQASHEEGLGLSVIEAMSCECALIATKIEGHTEIIENEDQAVLVEPESPEQLASAVAQLMDDSGRRNTLGREARSRAIARFSVENMIRGTEDLFRSVASSAV